MEKKIGKNISSGAEKVERVESFTQETVDSQKPAPEKKQTKKEGTMSKTGSKTPKTAQLKEEVAAEKRVKEAKKRLDKKEAEIEKKTSVREKKIEKKAAVQEKRLAKQRAIAEKKLARRELIAKKRAEKKENDARRRAELKAKRAERKAERVARKELLKNETKAEREKRLEREKRERVALARARHEAKERARENKLKAREAAHARKAEDRKHRREQRTERKRTYGFGGWLAAVISLGTACLILSAIVTAGAFRMNDMSVEAESGARSTLYEMVSVSEDLDENLGKLRVSAGANEQRQLLTDILVDTALLESAIEKIPVDAATGTDISSFVNRTGAYARQMLAKLARGQALSAEERENVVRLYEINDKLYNELNELVMNMSSNDVRNMLSGSGSMIEKFAELGQGTRPQPQDGEISEAPFSQEGNIGENRLTLLDEISSSEAEELAKQYFESYHIKEIKYTGETVAREIACYNFVLTDENGTEIFAEIAKRGGKLAFFDTYETCTQKNFDLETCDAIAREFLSGLGIGEVEAVWLSDGGMVANITYTTVVKGVRVYPEIIRVRVCEEKGRVVGMDARGYLLNDKEWTFEHAASESEARNALAEGLEPYAVNLAVIPAEGGEVLCYEFGCTYGEDEYIVYLDANTLEEVRIYRVRESARGSYLR